MADAEFWPIAWDALGAAPAPEVRAAVGPVAAEVLWCLAGRRYGLLGTNVRPGPWPAQPHDHRAPGGGARYPMLRGGTWYNAGYTAVGGPCGATTRVLLPGPVHRVLQVNIGGAVLAPAAYTLLDDWLVRTDGHAWPAQHPEAPPEDPGAWHVTYLRGVPVPAGGAIAAAYLGLELARARGGSGKCRLPGRVQSVAREGVDVLVGDPAGWFADGLTGVPETDQWLAAVNPGRLPQAPRVFSPDFGSARR